MEFSLIGICHPDNLQDHHNQGNEQLIAVSWYEEITEEELIEDIIVAMRYSNKIWEHLPKDDEQRKAYLTQIISNKIEGMDFSMSRIDESEEMYLYGYFSW